MCLFVMCLCSIYPAVYSVLGSCEWRYINPSGYYYYYYYSIQLSTLAVFIREKKDQVFK